MTIRIREIPGRFLIGIQCSSDVHLKSIPELAIKKPSLIIKEWTKLKSTLDIDRDEFGKDWKEEIEISGVFLQKDMFGSRAVVLFMGPLGPRGRNIKTEGRNLIQGRYWGGIGEESTLTSLMKNNMSRKNDTCGRLT